MRAEPDIRISDGAEVVERFEKLIVDRGYPCVGAKGAIGRGQMRSYVGRSITSAWDDVALVQELTTFARFYAKERPLFTTFAAFFPESPRLDEEAFEQAIWTRIASLQDKDDWLGYDPDEAVDTDPASPQFSLSFGGQGFFVVGMHPDASRPARQFECPIMIFNLHDQFERLRADGRYEKMRAEILERDRRLAGSVNPMLARFGEQSEARQYSGRQVGPDWTCPWQGRANNEKDKD
ncbi:guanitoxin biosynthesis heme-dependent pre-guanitoxin N-hydroxylase GntA [Sphingomicrobium arenosum]|uniref:guanitoxin biosynthesis heme-dependent pre-guanitoxin N-hydroxylase GntA n=1 Tax=Sphingomicrobium arenosum TaxID=2233861 RepID=UPI00224000D8|nr:guanitoxin biosynthesis heme-dependent pre-guanitoxin N-hydroxylase GntA [Sphingomicrobium arenosum]